MDMPIKSHTRRSALSSTTNDGVDSSTKSLSQRSTWREMSARNASLGRLDSYSSTSSENEGRDGDSTIKRTIDAIMNPARFAGLDAADVDPITYNTYSFFSRLWSIRGRNFGMIIAPLLMLFLWGLCWQILFASISSASDVQEFLASIDRLVVPILTPLSFLLTFRLGRAAVRFWDARRAIGQVIGICRANISIVSVGVISPKRARSTSSIRSTNEREVVSSLSDQDDEYALDLLCQYARFLAVFPIAVKHHVRPVTRKGWNQEERYKKQRFEIGTLLSEEDAQKVIMPNDDECEMPTISAGRRTRDPPLVVLNRLHQLAHDIAYCTYIGDDTINMKPAAASRAVLYQQITNQLNGLMDAYGAMERIKNTPLPFAYAIHLRTFLLLYLFLWNMISIAEYEWISIPFLTLLNWALLGIEAAAVECESPFEYRENHLTLGKVSVLISRNIGQALRELVNDIKA